MSWNFELVAGPFGSSTEGPVWDGEALLFTHINGSTIWRYDPKSGETTEYFSGTNYTNGLCFDARGNLYGCQSGGRGIARFEKDGTTITPLPNQLDGKRLNNPNDLAVDRQGRIWFSDPFNAMAGDQDSDHMSIMRLDPTGDNQWELKRTTFDISRPNGVLISRDQMTLYVAESSYTPYEPRELRAYPINDDGSLGSYTTLHTFGVDYLDKAEQDRAHLDATTYLAEGMRGIISLGRPRPGVQRAIDGMTLDVEGNIIACAGWEQAGPGPMIYVFAPSGRVLETHPLRVDRPTNCCFGGPDMRTLYVTTGEGHVFRAETDRTGWIMWP